MTAAPDSSESTTDPPPDHGRARCPECGGDPSQWRTPPAVSMFHWRKVVPVVVALVALVAFVWWCFGVRFEFNTLLESETATLTDPPTSYEEIRAIAGEETALPGPPLAARFTLPRSESNAILTPGEQYLKIGLLSEVHNRVERFAIGWPSRWYGNRRGVVYEDAVTLTDPIPVTADKLGAWTIKPDPSLFPARQRWAWHAGNLHYSPPPEETGGNVVSREYRFMAIGPVAFLLIIAWYAGVLLSWLINRFDARVALCASKCMKTGSLVLMLLLIVVMSVATREHDDRPIAQPTLYWSMLGDSDDLGNFVQTSITPNQLREDLTDPKSNRALAEELLAALEGTTSLSTADMSYLAFLFTAESEEINVATTVLERMLSAGLVYRTQYQRRAIFGPQTLMTLPRAVQLKRVQQNLLIVSSSGDPNDRVRRLVVSLDFVCGVLICAWLLWLITRVMTRILHRRIAKRRVNRGRCGPCGQVVVFAVV